MTLETLAQVTARVFASRRTFAARRSVEEPDDPAFVSVDQRRKRALLRAVTAAAPHWPEAERTTVAALLDVLWNLPAYERLVGAWGLGPEEATRAITWAMSRLVTAIDDEAPPPMG